MKIIGLLGGTGWSSTIGYYTLLNQMVTAKLGGYHSAQITLSSIDYHSIMANYGKDHNAVATTLKEELQKLLEMKPDCFMICCNSLHKYYDMIKEELAPTIPVFHAVTLTAKYLHEQGYKNVLLLATKFTMEDVFFTQILEDHGISVIIPDEIERNQIRDIHAEELMSNIVSEKGKQLFDMVITKYLNVDAVVSACTEFAMVLETLDIAVPVVDPMQLQCAGAVEFATT
jgi:aspartate racemase